MTQQDRCDMENVMVKAFESLVKDPAYGGRYVSLTPGHPNKISDGSSAAHLRACPLEKLRQS